MIRNITYDEEDNKFYFLTNKFRGSLGFYLIEFVHDNPKSYNFMTMWNHKLDLDDANINILRGHDTIKRGQIQGYKELIISFKTCFLNTYNVIV